MGRRSSDPRLRQPSPTRVFALVLLVVFGVEGAIMLCLPWMPPGAWHSPVFDGLLDATALTVVIAPVVWFLAVRPLRRSFEVRGALLRRIFESQEQERAHLARELNDGVGQHLTALRVGLRAVEEAGSAQTAGERARDLREVSSLAHEEIRRLARGLGPIALEELGLVAALERLCDDFQRIHDVKVVLRCAGETSRRVDPAAEAAVYRVVQEALANVARHARATEVEVDLARDDASIALTIRDDGCGFDVGDAEARARRSGGFGLESIRERTRLLGGDFALHARPGNGTSLEIRVPLAG
jgi:signal transduction histidine kinase